MSLRSVTATATSNSRPAMRILASTTSRSSGSSAAAARTRTRSKTGPSPARSARSVSRLVRAAPVSTRASTRISPLLPRITTSSTTPMAVRSPFAGCRRTTGCTLSVSLPGSIYERRYSINRVILGRDTFFSRDLHRGSNERGWPAVKIGVISKKQAYWSTQAILKSIRKHGHEGTFVKTDEVRLVVAGTDDAIYNGNSLRAYDVLIPRIGRSMTDFGKMLLRQLELLGIRTTPASDGLITARNKFLALQSLRQANIPIPRSIL